MIKRGCGLDVLTRCFSNLKHQKETQSPQVSIVYIPLQDLAYLPPHLYLNEWTEISQGTESASKSHHLSNVRCAQVRFKVLFSPSVTASGVKEWG